MKVSIQLNSGKYFPDEFYNKIARICHEITGLESIKGFSDESEIVLFSGIPKPGKNTKFMQSLSAGVNHVDFTGIAKNIIISSNADGYSIMVAETAIGLLLSFAKKICYSNSEIHNGLYRKLSPENYITLHGKKLGIIGYGGIGRETARLASSFSMDIYAYSRSYRSDSYSKYMDFDEIMKSCDFVLIALPLNKYTSGIVNDKKLSMFRGKAIINVGRGDIVDHDAMITYLKNNPDKFYLTDVWWNESNFNEKIPENVIITPHIAGISDSLDIPVEKACMNIKNYISGNPLNIVKREDYT